MKYFNSTKVADSRKKIRAPFTDGYKKAEVKITFEKEKEIQRERDWASFRTEWRKAELMAKLRGESFWAW